METLDSQPTTLIRCPACHGENPDNFRQCRFCRAWMFATARCGLCSRIVPTVGNHCPECGADFAVCTLEPVAVAVNPRAAQLRFWIRASAAAALVDASAVLALWIVSATRHVDTSMPMLALLLLLVVLCFGLSMRWYEPDNASDIPFIPLDMGGGGA